MPTIHRERGWETPVGYGSPQREFSQGGYIIPDQSSPQQVIYQLQNDNARLSSQVWKLQTDIEQLTQILAGVMEYVGLNPKKDTK